MMKQLRSLTLALAIVLVAGSSALASEHATERSAAPDMILDLLVVRPVSMAVSFATTGLYVGTVPLTFLWDLDEQAGNALVSQPWKFTSGRRLGRWPD